MYVTVRTKGHGNTVAVLIVSYQMESGASLREKVREGLHERNISGLNQGENVRSDEEKWDSGHSWKIKSVVFATGRHNQA